MSYYSIIQGDCLELLKDVPDGIIDFILTDMPYGITCNKWDAPIPLDILFSQYWRILKSTGVMALTVSQPFTSILVQNQIKFYRHEWIWIKNRGSNFANTVREPFKEHESVLIFPEASGLITSNFRNGQVVVFPVSSMT